MQLHAVTVTYLPESYHMKLENALDKTKIGESIDAKSWFETFEQTAKVNNIPLKPELIHSHRPVDYVLLEYAEQEKIDLIVVGTRGRPGLKRLPLGSAAYIRHIVQYLRFADISSQEDFVALDCFSKISVQLEIESPCCSNGLTLNLTKVYRQQEFCMVDG